MISLSYIFHFPLSSHNVIGIGLRMAAKHIIYMKYVHRDTFLKVPGDTIKFFAKNIFQTLSFTFDVWT